MAHAVDRIVQVGGANKTSSYTYYPVVIIGAGESGICMGARLRQVLGFDQFRIFERRSELGGTWYTNTYPGIACDVPAILYSFSFAQKSTWAAPYPPGSEIRKYLHGVVDKFQLTDKIQCDTSVKAVRWIEADEEWEIDLDHLAPGIGDMSTAERQAVEKEKGVQATVIRSETIRAKLVASAVGGLVEPNASVKVPGLETFQGKVVHTARWDPDVELRDKDVVVVGTGCSAAQVMASLVKPEYGIKSITQLLRSPPWVMPALDKDTFLNLVRKFQRYLPGGQNIMRKLGFASVEWEFLTHFPNTKRAQKGRQATAQVLLRHMRKRVPPQYHDILTPNYEVFCKRRIIDDGWFDALRDARAEITSQPLTAIGPSSVTIGPGRHYPPMDVATSLARTDRREIPCDVLIMANGFATNEWLHPLDVTGRHGRSLHETWKQRGGAQAYLGLCMDGFPNFFMIFGPNTATGHSSVILATENMVNLTLKLVSPVLRGEVRTVEVLESAERAWTDRIQKALKDCVFNSGGCRNWYVDQADGWNSTVYPFTQVHHTIRCMFPRWRDWDLKYTRKGLIKLWMRRVIKTILLAGLMVGINYVRVLGWTTSKQLLLYATRSFAATTLEKIRSLTA